MLVLNRIRTQGTFGSLIVQRIFKLTEAIPETERSPHYTLVKTVIPETERSPHYTLVKTCLLQLQPMNKRFLYFSSLFSTHRTGFQCRHSDAHPWVSSTARCLSIRNDKQTLVENCTSVSETIIPNQSGINLERLRGLKQASLCQSSHMCNWFPTSWLRSKGETITPGLWHHMTVRYKREDEGLPEISEDDLEESFTHGHGPGGQSVNKTLNCVVLKHLPTGVHVKVGKSSWEATLHCFGYYFQKKLRVIN